MDSVLDSRKPHKADFLDSCLDSQKGLKADFEFSEFGFLDSQSLDSWILELGFLDSQSFDSSNSEQFGLLNFQKLEFSKFQFFLLGDSFRLRPCLLVGIIFEKVKRELAAEPFCGLVFENLH